jgi:hypothetical protein
MEVSFQKHPGVSQLLVKWHPLPTLSRLTGRFADGLLLGTHLSVLALIIHALSMKVQASLLEAFGIAADTKFLKGKAVGSV